MRLLAAARRVPRAGKLLLLGAAGDLTGEIGEKLRSARTAYSLVVPPGRTIFRLLNIPEVGRRKRASALRLAAEAAITQPLDPVRAPVLRASSTLVMITGTSIISSSQIMFLVGKGPLIFLQY